MRKFGILLAALLLAAPLALFAQETQPAQEQAQPGTEQGTQTAQQGEASPAAQPGQPRPELAFPFIALSTMVGMPLSAAGTDNAGTLQDAYLTSDGRLAGVVTHLQNVPNVAPGSYILAPTTLTMEGEKLVLNLTSDPLPKAEGAKGSRTVPMDAVLASQLMQFNLVGQTNQNIGTVEDIVVNMQDATVTYVAINFSGALGTGEKVFAVPYDEVWYNLNRQTVTIYNLNQQAMEQNSGIDPQNWPETADTSWNRTQS